MKAVTVKELKKELSNKSHNDAIELCLRLSRFKKENKELLTYLLFESDNEQGYINGIKEDIDLQFSKINRKTNYLTKKGVRKILRETKNISGIQKIKRLKLNYLYTFVNNLKNLHYQ